MHQNKCIGFIHTHDIDKCERGTVMFFPLFHNTVFAIIYRNFVTAQ